MKKQILTAVLAAALFAPLAAQAGKAEYEAVYAQAQAAHKEAGAHKWLVTREALNKAKAAAEKGSYDEALAQARQALELAQRSIEQGKQQQTAWKIAVVR
jgi:hypothetical protein